MTQHDPRTCENSKPCTDCEHPIETKTYICGNCKRVAVDHKNNTEMSCPKCEPAHDITCEGCGKPATRNIQQCWVEYSMDVEGNYSDEPTSIESNGDNYHYCDDCKY